MVAGDVSKTPETWNPGIFNTVKALSEDVAVPIAGMVVTFVLCYELVSMVMEKNNMHKFDTSLFSDTCLKRALLYGC